MTRNVNYNGIVTIEHWKDEEAIAIHNDSDYFQSFAATINDFAVTPMDFKKYQA
ncbi:antibiotic biosynthesis monooxygenase [Bacillus sp. FSL R10-2789]|uniref:putative quinol monooxygenase n=1 Tax=Bacillus sp. FSL R10-2789 TaxID=2954662 RepID=UPI0030F88F8A